jgi:hypothetical protein
MAASAATTMTAVSARNTARRGDLLRRPCAAAVFTPLLDHEDDDLGAAVGQD